ncbi:1-phosphofructokinase family hexose kinase [Phaeacidiphilus oryzae]|uniref:1-phosphofructokinase family hexose kinase n=1 Tax=Phaeacidiphilus oryzae TaxID=348818 RepID=UPI00055C0552|nr:1-phosphofructokinase family hexose kinase [Phaeacidiphilus oryzae]
MILTVTPNAALDVSYHLPELRPGEENRVRSVRERAGGKGVNVARVLHALGEPVLAAGLAGGLTGRRIRDELAASGVPEALTEVTAESRRTVAVVATERGEATGLWEPGAEVAAGEWTRFRAAYRELLARTRAVALCGSLPPGAPGDAYAQLGADARAAGVPWLLDADGEALAAGLAAGPDLVKPNAAELRRVAGDGDGELAGAERLLALGARAVVVSLGAEGMLAVTPEGAWRAAPPRVVHGNATGAGDAAVAALSRGVARGLPWQDRVRDAVALSAAAVASPVAGGYDAGVYEELRPRVRVDPL